MKIANLGDPHIRNSIPKNRKPTYGVELWEKLNFISTYCENNGVEVILIPGDIFHTPSQPLEIMIRLATLIKETDKFITKIKWYCVLGQHDLFHHQKDSSFTSINLMHEAGLIRIIDEPILIGKDIWLYGCSYGEEIPEIKTEGTNILMIHAMIIKDKRLWEQQSEFLYSQHLLRKHNFDLIVSGDNHTFFQDHYRSRKLVNCGSLMRSNINQIDHKPCFFIYDSEERSLTKIEIPIKQDVFIFEEKVEIEDNFKDLFSSTIKENSEDFSINFRKNIELGLQITKLDEETKQFIKEIVYA